MNYCSEFNIDQSQNRKVELERKSIAKSDDQVIAENQSKRKRLQTCQLLEET
jgi:hypothetical protein